MNHSIEINGKKIRLTNLDKTYCESSQVTKMDCLNYYIKVYPYISNFLKNRPVSLTRYPNGFNGQGFYQKNSPPGKPDWVETINIKGVKNYPLINNMETFLWLCNLGTIEFHPWLSNIEHLETPDFGVLDVDPMEKYGFKEVLEIAKKIYDILELLDIKGYPKLTGSTGIQIFIPTVNRYTYETVREFIRLIYVVVNNQLPKTTTMVRKLNKREGKIYLDYLQNVRGQTLVAPYSIRPKKGAPISAPILWKDIFDGNLNSDKYNIKNSIEHIKDIANFYEETLTKKQNIEKAYNILQKIIQKEGILKNI